MCYISRCSYSRLSRVSVPAETEIVWLRTLASSASPLCNAIGVFYTPLQMKDSVLIVNNTRFKLNSARRGQPEASRTARSMVTCRSCKYTAQCAFLFLKPSKGGLFFERHLLYEWHGREKRNPMTVEENHKLECGRISYMQEPRSVPPTSNLNIDHRWFTALFSVSTVPADQGFSCRRRRRPLTATELRTGHMDRPALLPLAPTFTNIAKPRSRAPRANGGPLLTPSSAVQAYSNSSNPDRSIRLNAQGR